MNRTWWQGVLGGAVALALVGAGAGSASASQPANADRGVASRAKTDDRTKFAKERQELRANMKAAADLVASGKAQFAGKGAERAVKVTQGGKVTYVSYPTERTDEVFMLLAEFAGEGPLRNQIPQPDKASDNTTYWVSDFNVMHYDEMMNGAVNSFKDFFEKQSSGRFTANTYVTDWVTVPNEEAYYGHNWTEDEPAPPDAEMLEGERYWQFVQDSVDAWYNAQVAAGKTPAQIKEMLAKFDQQDRYDYDGDGVFLEPDGYMDHFSLIHAGEGEEAGGGAQGADAIWSHSWSAFPLGGPGHEGPDNFPIGGAQIGDTGFWVYDYVVQPENGGLGVFAHEYGHDLGLPDLYDTSGGGSNGTAYWTLMSSGSWLSDGAKAGAIGTRPNFMGPWEKLMLGWLDYKIVRESSTTLLGPAEYANTNAQAAIVLLPNKPVTFQMGKPYEGSYQYFSGSANNLNSTLTRTIDLRTAAAGSMSWYNRYALEAGYDYTFVEVSVDGGDFTKVKTYNGSQTGWVQDSLDLTPYAGHSVTVRFRTQNDGGVNLLGYFVDAVSLTVDGTTTTEGFESATSDWTAANGYTRVGATVTKTFQNYFMVENRQYVSYDQTLRTGPYSWVAPYLNNLVQFYPYQEGMLVWYVDTSQSNNNTSAHPGQGLVLPVDANPAPTYWTNPVNGQKALANAALLSHDSTFKVASDKYDAIHLRRNVSDDPAAPIWQVFDLAKRRAVTTFDDSSTTAYYSSAAPFASTKTPGSKVKVTAVKQVGLNMVITFSIPQW